MELSLTPVDVSVNDVNNSSLLPSQPTNQNAISNGDEVIVPGPEISFPAEIDTEGGIPEISVPSRRDEDYYFEDGSVILCIENVLFKIHKSHLKNHSAVFKDMFTLPPGDVHSSLEGSCDDYPIVIPGIEPSQFRNLMKMFYCPPSDEFFESLQTYKEDNGQALDQLKFYLDIAKLSHRFDISQMEKWANGRMKHLINIATRELALGPSEDSTYSLLDALGYYRTIQDFHMVHTVRAMIQCYCVYGKDMHDFNGVSFRQLVTFFKTPNLAQSERPIFGFLFTRLLQYDVAVWESSLFTKMDRMALFSAATYLRPLPSEMQGGFQTPLFLKPTSAGSFLTTHWSDIKDKDCNDGCREKMFQRWLQRFSDNYYSKIKNTENREAAFNALTSIPYRRVTFANENITFSCSRACLEKVIDLLDQDLERLFIEIAGYYREIQ